MQLLTQHFDVQATGYCCQTRDLWQVLVAAAAQGSTIEATCNDLPEAPDSNTVRAYLNDQLTVETNLRWRPTYGGDQLTVEQVRPVEADFNRALTSQLPRWFHRQLRHQGVQLAIDLHDVPYYGKTDQLNPTDHWVCRGQAQAGTTRFYRCATAYVMQRDVRWTLAVTFVHPRDSRVSIVQRLIKQMHTLGLRRGCLYLDKAFCAVPVLRYLQEQTTFAAIVAAPLRGKGGKEGSGRGTRALCQGRASYFTYHTFINAEHGALRVPVAVVRTFCRRRDGTYQAQWLVYVLLQLRQRKLRITQVRQRYRSRFGIESSYRLLEQVRLRTTSPNEALRFFCIGLALLLGSVWIALHWKYLQVAGSGPRRVAREHFPLERMANFLRRAVETIYGVISLVQPQNVKPVIY